MAVCPLLWRKVHRLVNSFSVCRFVQQRSLTFSAGLQAQKKTEEKDAPNLDEPIKFSTSKAQSHSPYDTFLPKSKAPWYQGYIVLGSTAVFVIYFLFLREENDWDEEISQSIYEKIPPLKVERLKAEIKEAKRFKKDTSDLERELEILLKQYGNK